MFTHRRKPISRGAGRRRLSPLMLLGLSLPLVLALVAAAVFVIPRLASHAAAVNGDCTLIVPPNPLSAQGLATPYQLVATNPANGPCNEANPNQATFVQGAIFDPAKSQISIYNPLVIDQGTQPAVAPVPPTLPQGAIVALWGGSNANNITLQDSNGSLRAGRCVNGVNGSIFGQFWFCNAPAFFRAANRAIRRGSLVVPPLGTAKDGKPCPSTRDFSLVDQDPSDNVTTTYLINANGQSAQMTAANAAALQGAQTLVNGSDERLLAVAVDGALGCTPWMAPDLANGGQMVPALPLNELQAAAHQTAPVALVPNMDPMVLVNGNANTTKLNLYRLGVDQPPTQNQPQMQNQPPTQNQPQMQNQMTSSTQAFCANLRQIGLARMTLDAPLTVAGGSPAPAVANSLLTFLAQRFVTTYGANGGLNCVGLLNQPDPVAVQTDGNGVAISVTINGTTVGGGNGGGGGGGGNGNTPNCVVNGTNVAGCTGTTTINGQTCTFAFANNTVTLTCPANQQPGQPTPQPGQQTPQPGQQTPQPGQ